MRARTCNLPRPVSYARSSSGLSTIRPPVGKSGPFTYCISSLVVMSGLSIWAMVALITSRRLCGGMLVARPTAMPDAPFTSRFGNLPGSISGSLSESSKLSLNGTVSLSISRKSSSASGVMRASVYRIAAGLSPSIEPKLPWPSTSIPRITNGCAMRASASYTDVSPCGWYLPRQSPTMRAHLRCGLSGLRFSSIMVYSMRRCTGFSPSSTRGSARSSITYSEYGSILSCITSSMGCWIIVSPLISGSCGFFAM